MVRWSSLRVWLMTACVLLVLTVILVDNTRNQDQPRGRFLRNLKGRSADGKPVITGLNSTDPEDALWAERRRHIVQVSSGHTS
ncbi:hypothetical protein GE061_016904 [Apolygus lucorum]|uniref:Uncharacterized protein n=1 Tax=Apolygus lucorum TaxID=248454 RepID=A0A6A4JXA7_APOLU|nr:hypothetical protein GE061_016904 [Apolygus lucorum]